MLPGKRAALKPSLIPRFGNVNCPVMQVRPAYFHANTVRDEVEMTLDIPHLQQWIDRKEHRTDQVTPVPYAALSATLDRVPELPAMGTLLPPLWHWLYFQPLHLQSEIGEDGHPRRGGFLPPVPLPRCMWAGGCLSFGQRTARHCTLRSR